MKAWLRNRLHKFLYPQDEAVQSTAIAKYATNRCETATEIQFTVAAARGGLIVCVRTYDKQRDRHDYLNHIIHDDEDVAKNVADIVSVELMKA
jgi:hypothetical protein